MSSSHSSTVIELPRVTQKTDSYCGPATLELLYSHLRKKIGQDEIVKAARIAPIIQKKGSRPSQLANAVKKLTPNFQLWFKQNASVEDLEKLVTKYQMPVVINWQGLFYDKAEDETPNNKYDRGHYSVVVGINTKKDQITIQDPYRFYSDKNRTFSLSWFLTRWMDRVREKNNRTGKFETLKTHQFLFVLAPKTSRMAKDLELMPPTKLRMLKVAKM